MNKRGSNLPEAPLLSLPGDKPPPAGQGRARKRLRAQLTHLAPNGQWKKKGDVELRTQHFK